MKRATRNIVRADTQDSVVSNNNETNRRWLHKLFLAVGALIAVILLIISSFLPLAEYPLMSILQQERGVVTVIAGLQLILLAISGDENF